MISFKTFFVPVNVQKTEILKLMASFCGKTGIANLLCHPLHHLRDRASSFRPDIVIKNLQAPFYSQQAVYFQR